MGTQFEALTDYGRLMGWVVHRNENGLVLPLPAGWVAVHAPAGVGAAAYRHPLLRDACGPVLVLPESTRRSVFLAEVDDGVLAGESLPPGVGLFRSPHPLLLPPSTTEFGRVRWAVAPEPTRRWLPTATTVISALGEVLRHVRTLPVVRHEQSALPETA